jgi:hypothetical protein
VQLPEDSSNGEDISMFFDQQRPELVKEVVTLDNLRVPFVTDGRLKILPSNRWLSVDARHEVAGHLDVHFAGERRDMRPERGGNRNRIIDHRYRSRAG